MDWKRRIELCKELLGDMEDMLPEGDNRSIISTTLKCIVDYTDNEAFLENSEKEKEIDSWNILMNTISRCNAQLEAVSEILFPRPPRYVTHDEAYGKLLQEYAEALKKGDESVASMNINEWMEANRYVIVADGDERLKDRDDDDDESVEDYDDDDDESVNSQTDF